MITLSCKLWLLSCKAADPAADKSTDGAEDFLRFSELFSQRQMVKRVKRMVSKMLISLVRREEEGFGHRGKECDIR